MRDQVALFSDALQRYGFELRSYTDPITALEKFRPGIYDVAIIDVLMPELDGMELS